MWTAVEQSGVSHPFASLGIFVNLRLINCIYQADEIFDPQRPELKFNR